MAARRYWRVQVTENVHREAMKRQLAQKVQTRNDLVHRTASLYSAHAMGRRWNSQTADSGDDCLQLAF